MQINQLLTPYNFAPGTINRIKYIVIHYVGATGGAEANCKYYAAQNRGASAHYFVGFAGEIWQAVEDKNLAWHCAGKKYANTKGGTYHGICTNANSIGIEMCVRNRGSQADTSRDWYFEDATVEAAAELTRYLMNKYGVPASHVIRHYDVTGKICPNPYVMDEEKWIQFKVAIGIPQQEPRWVKDDKGWWYQNADGTWAKSEWRLINHHRYLFGANGYIRKGWHRWNPDTKQVDPDDGSGDWYYLQETGDLEGACWHGTEKGSLEIWYVK